MATTCVNASAATRDALECFTSRYLLHPLLHRRHRIPEALPRRRRVPREVAVRQGIAVAPGRAGACRAAVHAASGAPRHRRQPAGRAASRFRAASADRLLPGGHARAVTAPDRAPFRDPFRVRA